VLGLARPERQAAERSLTEARERGWTVVSIRNDWKTVFAKEITP